jgi:hypothetical protein
MSEMRPLPKYRDDLVELVKAYKGTIKRPLCNMYRHQMASGKLSVPRFERPVKYAANAYRADKKKGHALPLGIPAPTTTKTRD